MQFVSDESIRRDDSDAPPAYHSSSSGFGSAPSKPIPSSKIPDSVTLLEKKLRLLKEQLEMSRVRIAESDRRGLDAAIDPGSVGDIEAAHIRDLDRRVREMDLKVKTTGTVDEDKCSAEYKMRKEAMERHL
jgi:hypothetical protein